MSTETEKETPFMQTPWVVRIKSLIQGALAIYSLSACITAYIVLNSAKGDVDAVTANWQMLPITDFLILSNSQTCASGYESATSNTYPGINPNCGCKYTNNNYPFNADTNAYYTSHVGACNSTEISVGCATTNSNSFPIKSWRGSQLCVKRGGEAALKRPLAKAGVCQSGYTKCGSASGTVADGTTCQPTVTGVGCPLTWAGSTNSKALPVFASYLTAINAQSFPSLTYSDNTAFLGQRTEMAVPWLPVVEFLIAKKQSGSDTGPCKHNSDKSTGQNNQWYPTMASTSNLDATTAMTTTSDQPLVCSTNDPRWSPFDTLSEQAMLLENILISPDCKPTGATAPTLAQAQAADVFTTTSFRCSTTATDYTRCRDNAIPSTTCKSTDNICKDAHYQSKCGALMRIYSSTSSSSTFGLYQRNQIMWKDACASPYAMTNLNNAQEPLTSAVSAQTAYLYANIFINSLCLCTYVYMLYLSFNDNLTKQYFESDPANASDDCWYYLSTGSYYMSIIKFPFTIASLVLVSAISDFYAEISLLSCSDATTNATIATLGDALPAAKSANTQTLVVDILMLLFTIYFKYCSGSGEEEGTTDVQMNVQQQQQEQQHQPMPMGMPGAVVVQQPMMMQQQPMMMQQQPMMMQQQSNPGVYGNSQHAGPKIYGDQ